MKKLILAITCLVSSFAYAQVAEWSEPKIVDVDTGGGLIQLKSCIDNRGWIHVVWTHVVEKWQHNDIYYKKSVDLGDTWSSVQDISMNENQAEYFFPWIAYDSQNNLHVTFSENRGDYSQRVLYTSCNAQGEWQQKIDTIAEKNPSEYIFPGWSTIAVDAQDNIILTWGTQFPTMLTFYRTKDVSSNEWSPVLCPLSNKMFFGEVVTYGDTIYYAGSWFKNNNYQNPQSFYTTYNCSSDAWETPLILNKEQLSGWAQIALDQSHKPAMTNLTLVDSLGNGDNQDAIIHYTEIQDHENQEDITIIPNYNGSFATDFIFDQYNQAHVVQNESIDGKEKLMHYRKTANGWIGEQLDLNYNHFSFGHINLQAYGEDIYLVYVDGEKIYDTWEQSILLRKYTPQPESIADNAEVSALGTFKVYPNPVQGACHLDYQLANTAQVDIAVYDMQGRQVSTIYQGQQAAGAQQLSWDGGNLSPGVYIVRLQVGKYVVNRKITVK